MDRFKALSIFVAVAEEGGFAAAGRRVGLSAPSVTRLVSELETDLGAALFHRTTRSVQLTQVGEGFFVRTVQLLGDLDEAVQAVAGQQDEPSGNVSITGSVLFGRIVLTPLIFELMDLYPLLRLSTLFADRIVHMVDEGLDVAVRLAHLPDSSLMAIRVGAVRRVVCASPAYLDAYGEPASIGDLEAHQIVQFAQNLNPEAWSFQKAGQVVSFRTVPRLMVNNADAAIAAAVEGRGITRVLSYQIADHVAAGRLVHLLEAYEGEPIPVHVVHKEGAHVSRRVRVVVDHLVSALRVSSLLARETN
ncbi:MAG: LysR family transcriptional regulator [Parvibaculum sp.]